MRKSVCKARDISEINFSVQKPRSVCSWERKLRNTSQELKTNVCLKVIATVCISSFSIAFNAPR